MPFQLPLSAHRWSGDCRQLYISTERKFRRNSPQRPTLPAAVRRCEYETARKNGWASKRQLWKERSKERAREDVSSRISSRARSGKNGENHLASPRPFSISLLRYSSTAAFNDHAGHPRRPLPLFLTRPRRVRRAWQKATNGADSERKECSRRLNWLGNGWFMGRFTTADPQSATPLARERREKVRDPPSPAASSHANWNG